MIDDTGVVVGGTNATAASNPVRITVVATKRFIVVVHKWSPNKKVVLYSYLQKK